jgi:predicted nucleotidyltransferase
MLRQNPAPTRYPEVNRLLDELGTRVQAILGANLRGIYLYGSLTLDAFTPETSDVDFLVVMAGKPDFSV